MRQATLNLQESTVTESDESPRASPLHGASALTITTSLAKLSITHLFQHASLRAKASMLLPNRSAPIDITIALSYKASTKAGPSPSRF